MEKIPAHRLVSKERKKHFVKFGKTVVFDRQNNNKRELRCAARYLLYTSLSSRIMSCPRGWDPFWWKDMCKKSLSERLIIAASLLCAEYDRMYLK